MQASAPARPVSISPRIFFIAWFIIGLIQATGTGLLDDEAYYWVYSRFLDWGYFDHPPMTALLIKLGTLLFPGELGARFFILVLNTLTLMIIHSMLREKNNTVFYWIAGGLAVLQIGGMLAVPDLPLVFFIACFFYVYKRFLEYKSFTNTFLLGAVMAAMLYSKYHGVLVVFFTLLSNVKLLKYYQSWLAVLIASILFIPHLVWQYQHGFPSVQYHLFERNAVRYQAGFTIEYVLGQLAFMGPIIGWLLLWGAWKHKAETPLEKALRWTLFGILGFFAISTIKGRVDANWTVPIFIPLIVLGHTYLSRERKWWPFLRISAFATIMLVLVVRVYMLMDVNPLPWLKKDEFHKNKERAAAIKAQANGRPVVFVNSYQNAAKHWFYSGDTALSLNSIHGRRNNYNFWPIEQQFQGRNVLVVNHKIKSEKLHGPVIVTPRGNMTSYSDSCFSSRMGDWFELPSKVMLRGDSVEQEGTFTAGLNEFARCRIVDRRAAVAGMDEGDPFFFSLLSFVPDRQKGATEPVKLSAKIPGKFPFKKRIRYGLPTSIPDTYTLNSLTVEVEEE